MRGAGARARGSAAAIAVVVVVFGGGGGAELGVARRRGRSRRHDAAFPGPHGTGGHEEGAGEPRLRGGVAAPVELALLLELVGAGVGTRDHGGVVVAGERDDDEGVAG